MLFLVRSAFWLGMVYSAMPFDAGEQGRELTRLRAALAASCPAQPPACAALSMAATHPAPGGDAAKLRPSADSLTAADLTPPWRGKSAQTRRAVLAHRAAMPI
jgi:hypothetical protein